MKFYLIKVKETNTVIKYSGSLKAFMEDRGMECDDGHRRALSHTRERDSYYKGYKVLFYGTEDETEKEMTPKRNVLVIGDLHLPFEHKNAFKFASKIYDENNITDVVFIGDIIDNHYSSFHDSDPDGHGAGEELRLVSGKLDVWKNKFVNAMLTTGNHDNMNTRKTFKAGLSKRWVKSLNEMFDLVWDCSDFHKIGNFLFTHGVGLSAKGRSIETGNSVVQGHLHSKFSCEAISNGNSNCTYAIQTGCLIDRDAYAFSYGKFGRNPALGLVVIEDIDGDPTVKMISMPSELKK